jgi:hypothetical protein
MDDIYYAARTINQLVIAVLLVVMVFFIMAPGWAGTWLAERDIAYDKVWGTYVGDCDCTDELP